MGKILTVEEYNRMSDEYSKIKYTCSKCGHKVIIPNSVCKQLCRYCGIYVFKNKKDEYLYRIKERLK